MRMARGDLFKSYKMYKLGGLGLARLVSKLVAQFSNAHKIHQRLHHISIIGLVYDLHSVVGGHHGQGGAQEPPDEGHLLSFTQVTGSLISKSN